MSREQGRDAFRRVRQEMYDPRRSSFGLNSRTASSSSYQDTVERSTRERSVIFPSTSNRSIRDAANMPIFLEDTHESNILSRDFDRCDSNVQPSNRLHNIPISAALEALQSYGPSKQSSSDSTMQKSWSVGFHTNVSNPSEKSSAFPSSILKSKDSNVQTHSAESPSVSTSDISCPPFSDLNLNNVDEEDEYLYGDSNSLPEMPQLLKNDSDQSNIKTDHPGWSDDEDLFDESSNASLNKLKVDEISSSTVWSLRNKSIPLKLTKKLERNTNDSSRNMPDETFSVKQQHSSVSSMDFQNIKHLPNKIPEKDEKSILPDRDSKVASTSGIKSKYHIAAEVLKKKNTEKSNLFANVTRDFPSNDPIEKNNSVSESFKKDVWENKLTSKSNNPIKGSKELKIRKPPEEDVKRLPKAFLPKDINNIVDFISKPQRKRPLSKEVEYAKHPRHENYRNVSPNSFSPYQPSRHRSPVEEFSHRSPYHSRQRSPGNDSRYRISPHDFKDKSPHRDYDKHSYEYSTRHIDGRWYHSRSPSRKSTEPNPRYNKYRARSPGSFRSKERSRSPGSFRSKERSRSPRSFRSKERSRSPGYHRFGVRSHEHEHKKDSCKSRELLYKSIPRDSESRKRKKGKNFNSDDSFCSLSLESESASSDSSDDTQGRKQKSTTKPKEKVTDDTKLLKTDASKVEKKAAEDACAKEPDISSLHDNISQNLADICNFQDKTPGDIDLTNDFFKAFDKDKEDKLINIVKMFENSQIISQLVEGVQEHATLTGPIPPLDASHNTPNLLTPSQSVPNVSYPNIPSTQSYPIMPSVPIPFPPPSVNSFPPFTFPPPPMIAPPVVPPPVVPPPVPISAPSVYSPFPVSLPTVDVCRISDSKQVKKRPATLRPISITDSIPSKLSKEQSQPSSLQSAESKDKNVEYDKAIFEKVVEHNNSLIETYKKVRTDKHYAHIKVNNCVEDMIEMRKIMEETWGKKVNPSDRVFHSKCKNILSVSSNSLTFCLKEAKRLDEELSRLKARLPKEIVDEIGNIKIQPPKNDTNTRYSCYDTSNHTCYLCYKQFPNLLGILEHLHSVEHKEKMTSNDKDWTKKFKKPEQNEEGKNVVLKPVAGVEFMKPFTGYFCSLCSETLLDSVSAEQHLKSHDHFYQYKDFVLKNPVYERKCLFKKYVQHSVFSKDKKKKEMQEKEQQLNNSKKAEEANERVKNTLKDLKSKEKIVEELEDDDADPLASKNQNVSGIKLTLSGDNEKDNVKEKGSKASTTKTVQKVVFIGKAPNYKARPKPWYKKDVYLKNTENSPQSSECTTPTVTLTKAVEKHSENVRELSPSNKSDVSAKSNQNFLGSDISETVKKRGNTTPKKVIESTCLTEEDSKMLSPSSNDVPLSCKEKNSNDLTTEGESKNLNTSGDDLKNIPSTKKIEEVSDSDSILNSKQSKSGQNKKDNQPGSFANEKRDNTMPLSKDSTVNQALKNILLGTDSSVHQDIPLSEIQLPTIENSNNTVTNSLLHGESNVPIPMEIEDTNDKTDFDFQPKLITEEDRDLYLLGINREDLIPLVAPVPPPSSVLNCSSPSHSPSLSSSLSHKSHVTHNTPHTTTEVNENKSKVIPVLVSNHPSKSPYIKKKTSSENKSNILIQANESLVKPDTVKINTSVLKNIELKDSVTICETAESSDVNTNDISATVTMKSQEVNIESLDTSTNREDIILQINETSSETTKSMSLEIDSVMEISSQISDICEGNERVNKVFSDDNENFKHPDNNLNLTEAVSEIKMVNQTASGTDRIMLKSEHANSDNKLISKGEPSNSSNVVDINTELPDVKDSGVSSSSINPHEVNESSANFMSEKISGLELAQDSADENQLSSENAISDMEECASSNKTIPVENQSTNINFTQDIVLGQSLNRDSSNKVIDKEICKAVHMQDQDSDIKQCQNLIIQQPLHQESCKESVSDTCISPDTVIKDKQSSSDCKPNKSSEAKHHLNQNSVNESTLDIKVRISDNKTVVSDSGREVVPEQSSYQDSHKEDVSDMEVCDSICETISGVDLPSSIKPNQNLTCSTDSVIPMQNSEKNISVGTVDPVVKENVSEQQAVHRDVTLFDMKEHEELITTSSSTDDSHKGILSSQKNISIGAIDPVVQENVSEQQEVHTDVTLFKTKEHEELISTSLSDDSHKEIQSSENISMGTIDPVVQENVSEQQAVHTDVTLFETKEHEELISTSSSDDSRKEIQSSENVNMRTIDPAVKENVSEQQAVNTDVTLFEKKEQEFITTSSSTYDSSKETISNMEISYVSESADTNITTPVNNSSEDILASNSDVIPEQCCFFENISSPEAVRMEIIPEQQTIITEKSQCDVKSDQDLNFSVLNQNLVVENTFDVTESRLLQEDCILKKSNETDFVENKNCDMSTVSSDLVSKDSKNISLETNKKNLQLETVSVCVKNEHEVTPTEEVTFQPSSNQCYSTSEKTVLYLTDASAPGESVIEGERVIEGLNSVPISTIGESASGQKTPQLKPDTIPESFATVKRDLVETFPDCNTSIMSQMDDKQTRPEINLNAPGLEDKAGDPESKTHLSSSSGEVFETQNLPKSDTDTDEYENEE